MVLGLRSSEREKERKNERKKEREKERERERVRERILKFTQNSGYDRRNTPDITDWP